MGEKIEKNFSLPPGFAFQALVDEGPHLFVSRAIRESDGLAVLLKTPSPTADLEDTSSFLWHEYMAARDNPCEGIINPLEYREQGGVALVLEAFDGLPLCTLSKLRSCPSNVFLDAAHSIAAALACAHRKGLSHGFLSPRHVYLGGSRENPQVKLTGMGTASFGLPIAEVEYCAPEIVDDGACRARMCADLYSLGIIFYEMLTGIVPFRSEDADEIRYWHKARTPIHPREINGAVPTVLADMVLRLLSKEPMERFAGASELADTIARLRDAITQGKKIDDFFHASSTAQGCFSRERIFGREFERIELYDAHKRAWKGERVFSVISGYAGIGKTVLAMELGEEASQNGEIFLHGKFEQYGSGEPYSAFCKVFSQGVRNILGGSNAVVGEWRNRIGKALGNSVGLLAEMVPELHELLGKLPVPPSIDSANEENRLHNAFAAFMGLFAEKDHPLLLFIDDLQWADMPSLRLVRHLVSIADLQFFHLLVAYRDNEVGDDHPLTVILKEMDDDGIPVHRVFVGSLEVDAVKEMLAESFSARTFFLEQLAFAVRRKTGGNPFFIKKFIPEITKKGFIAQRSGENPVYDIAAIEAISISDNVADLLIQGMAELPENELRLLKLLSCLGSTFKRHIAHKVANGSAESFNRILRRLAGEGYLAFRGTDECAFIHDRIQEAAHSIMNEEELKINRLRIGRKLLELYGDEPSDALFGIVDNLNASLEMISDGTEREKLRKLNLLAGDASKKSADFAAAAKYYGMAMELSTPDAWEFRHDETFALHRNCAECLYLSGEHAEAERVIERALENELSSLEKVEVLSILIDIKTAEAKFKEVIDLSNKALSSVGFTISYGDVDNEIKDEYLKINEKMNRDGNEYFFQSKCQDTRESQVINKILKPLSLVYYFTDLKMVILSSLRMFQYTTKYGTSNISLPWVSKWIVFDFHLYNNFERSFQLALRTIEKGMEEEYKTTFCDMSQRLVNLIFPWKRHLNETIPYNERGLELGFKNGDIEYVGITLVHMHLNYFHLGIPLHECMRKTSDVRRRVLLFRNIVAAEILSSITHFISAYMLDDGEKQEEMNFDIENVCHKYTNPIALFHFHVGIMQLQYVLKNYRLSLSSYDTAMDYISSALGVFHHADRVFYHALSLIALINSFDEAEKAERMKEIDADLAQLALWASHCPQNFLHRKLLVEAELARLRGATLEAMRLYDQAIVSARENGYVQIEAVACERTGEFWLSLGKGDFARAYLRRSFEHYAQWGASRKCTQMRKEYPWLFADRRKAKRTSQDDSFLTESLESISKSDSFDSLIKNVIGIALKYSGADRFLLFASRGKNLFLLADSSPGGSIIKPRPIEMLEKEPLKYPVSLVQSVFKNGDTVLLGDNIDPQFHDTYFFEKKPKSVFCTSSKTESGRVIWYFEHNTLKDAFARVATNVLEELARHGAAVIARLAGEESAPGGTIAVKEKNKSIFLPFNDIVFISSEGRSVAIHTNTEMYRTHRLMKKIEAALPKSIFVRIHRGHVANIEFIERIERLGVNKFIVVLKDEKKSRLPVGRAYLANLKKKMRD